ncbi:hypothetical protein C723_2086 [Christiangramia flava JLT2011]|uniref:Uncharacterized protein n=1 Tax=Christiangramia flava JLT2011 TaxID=1229726 RepID=A0A1L7I6N1_9FLAO|nr:hypothetical protein GRFL_2051 [Christiangramia flava JLT2011]OSS39080.1 hypothetical protein C723_2086 [Christiangramia flava JLT2011]
MELHFQIFVSVDVIEPGSDQSIFDFKLLIKDALSNITFLQNSWFGPIMEA